MNIESFKVKCPRTAFDDVASGNCIEQYLYYIEFEIAIEQKWKERVKDIAIEAAMKYYRIDYSDIQFNWYVEEEGNEEPFLENGRFKFFLTINSDETIPAIDAYGVTLGDYHPATWDSPEEVTERGQFAEISTFANWFKECLPTDWEVRVEDYSLMTEEDFDENCNS